MTHRKDPIDRVNCCHLVLGHCASRKRAITCDKCVPLSISCLRGCFYTFWGDVQVWDKQKLIASMTTEHECVWIFGSDDARCFWVATGSEGWLTATTSSLRSLSRPIQQSQIGTAESWRKEKKCFNTLHMSQDWQTNLFFVFIKF